MRSIICIERRIFWSFARGMFLWLILALPSSAEICMRCSSHQGTLDSLNFGWCGEVLLLHELIVAATIVDQPPCNEGNVATVEMVGEGVGETPIEKVENAEIVEVIWDFSLNQLETLSLAKGTSVEAMFDLVAKGFNTMPDPWTLNECLQIGGGRRTHVHLTSDRKPLGKYTLCVIRWSRD